MQLTLTILTIVISLLLILVVLVQQRGAGVGQAFGGESTVYRTRRGAERFLFTLTIILGTLYVAVAIATIAFS